MNRKQRRAASPAEVHFNRAYALMRQGKLDKAVAANRREIGIKPDFASSYYNLSVCIG